MNNRGAALLSVLVVLCILSALLARLWYPLIAHGGAVRALYHRSRCDEAGRQAIATMVAVTSQSPFGMNNTRLLQRFAAALPCKTREDLFLRRTIVASTIPFPRWTQFTGSSACRDWQPSEAPQTLTPSGYSLRSCRQLQSTLLSETTLIEGNLVLAEPLELQSKAFALHRLVIFGALSLRELSLKLDPGARLEIVSTGAVQIEELNLQGDPTNQVLIFSAAGEIEIDVPLPAGILCEVGETSTAKMRLVAHDKMQVAGKVLPGPSMGCPYAFDETYWSWGSEISGPSRVN